MTEPIEGRSKAAAVEKLEDDSELAVLTKQLAFLMATLDNKNSTSSNQRNKEGQKRNKGKGSGNKRPGNNNRNDANGNNGSNSNQNQTQGDSRLEVNSSASNAKGGLILVKTVLLL